MTQSLVLGLLFALPGMVYGSVAANTLPCPVQTLAYYETNYVSASLGTYANSYNTGNSCTIGILLFNDFALNASSGAPGGAADILVTPNLVNDTLAFSQVPGDPNQAFTVGANQPTTYQIQYGFFIDPAPVLDGADLSLDPPMGAVSVTQAYCNDSYLANTRSGLACFDPITLSSAPPFPQTLSVVNPTKLQDSILFNPPATKFAEVQTTITLGADGKPASFDQIIAGTTVTNGTTTTTPEPSLYFVIASGLFILGGARHLTRRR